MTPAHLLSDCEVDQVGSDAHFRQVMRIRQLGGHVQLEVGIVVDIRGAKPNEAAVALAGDTALQQWQQLRLQAATHFLDQKRVAKADAGLQGTHEGGIPGLAHPQAHLAFHPLHPPVAHAQVSITYKLVVINTVLVTLVKLVTMSEVLIIALPDVGTGEAGGNVRVA